MLLRPLAVDLPLSVVTNCRAADATPYLSHLCLDLCHPAVPRQLAVGEIVTRRNARWAADDIDPDTAIVPVDELAAQALEVQAEDMALEDTLYALQKAFQGGHLDATTYLRQVGLLP